MGLKVNFALAERRQKVKFDSEAGSQEMKKDLVSNWTCLTQPPKSIRTTKCVCIFYSRSC
jgi:hypothetical protein